VDRRTEVDARHLGVVRRRGVVRPLGVATVVGIVINEAVKHMVCLTQLVREGKENSVLGPHLVG
jgi:hypothetical protein